MYWRQLVLLILAALCLHFSSYTQKKAQPFVIRPLSIGDTAPDVALAPLYNHPAGARLSDFRGKWLILDFWFGACPGCIEAFPKLEALQAKLKANVQFLLVNFESQDLIERNFKRWRHKSAAYRYPRLPSLVSDTLFHQLFPHQYYPHEVWIDPQGVVRAFTGAAEVTEANLLSFIAGKPPTMEEKIDFLEFSDVKAPVLSQVYPVYPDRLLYYSAVLEYIPGISGGLIRQVIDTAKGTVRVSRKNRTILELFSLALTGLGDPYQSARFDYGKRVEIAVADCGRYFYSSSSGLTKGAWQAANCFTYEAVLPLSAKEAAEGTMLQTLELFFDSKAAIEKRRRRCWVLIRRSKERELPFIADAPRDTTGHYIFANTTGRLVERIATAFRGTSYLFTDGTGYEGYATIALHKDSLASLPLLRKMLQSKYDLDLIEEEREVEVLVFRENAVRRKE